MVLPKLNIVEKVKGREDLARDLLVFPSPKRRVPGRLFFAFDLPFSRELH
jgi:hypothetical protein